MKNAFFAASCMVVLSSAGQAQPSLLYVLQPDATTVSQLANNSFEWLVLEPTYSNDNGTFDFTSAEIGAIKAGPCEKRVLAYLSIGEAESYRPYWNSAWVDAQGAPIPGVAPSWLGATNPQWEGNYKVRYWQQEWQDTLILSTPTVRSPLDRIIDQGFDGIYLDIVDGFYYWSQDPSGPHEISRNQARERMVTFIERLAAHARDVRGKGQFLVFPQNAQDIIRNEAGNLDSVSERYFEVIDGIGNEDVFYDELTLQGGAGQQYILTQLEEYSSRQKTVLVADYVVNVANQSATSNAARVQDFVSRSGARGFIPYAAMSDRSLDEILIFSGSGWISAQPVVGCAALPALTRCATIDFNRDGLFPDDTDLIDFLSVLAGGACSTGSACDRIDFNRDGLFPDDADLIAFLRVLAGGTC